MSELQAYLQLGFEHILDPRGYDHILFVMVLCALYSFQEWRKVLILVTAFTLGHSVTLALATLNVISFSSSVIELLIPITILITALTNYAQDTVSQTNSPRLRYALAAFFGLIHGMGFSTYLRSLLGTEESIVAPLFAFNVGLEIGQLVIVAAILGVATVFVNAFNLSRLKWNHFVSGVAGGMALSLIIVKLSE
jgi:HupE / UreJ protein